MKVLAVIVNHKQPELVLHGLKSLTAELDTMGGGCRAVVAGGFGDGSADVIEQRLPRYWLESRQPYFMKNPGPWKPPHLLSNFGRFNFLAG